MQEVSGTGVRGHKVLWRQRHWPEGQGRGLGPPSREGAGGNQRAWCCCDSREEPKEVQAREGAGKRGAGSLKKLLDQTVEARGWLSAGKYNPFSPRPPSCTGKI